MVHISAHTNNKQLIGQLKHDRGRFLSYVYVIQCPNDMDDTQKHRARSRLDRSVELLYKCYNSVPVG